MSNTILNRLLVPLLLAGTAAACGEGGNEIEGGANAAAGEAATAAPDDAAALAEDPELANEAAADEAADMETFGGNAAAMDGNQQ